MTLDRGQLIALAIGAAATLAGLYTFLHPRVRILRDAGVYGPGDPGTGEALLGRALASILLLVGLFFLWLAT